MLLEDTEKNALIRECQMIVLFLSVNPQLWEMGILHGMCLLTFQVVYIMYGWKYRSSRLLLPPMLLYTIHYKIGRCVPITVCARASTTQCNCMMCILSVSQQWTKESIFTGKIFFTYKSCLTGAGITSIHTKYVWSDENPHSIRSHHYQQ
jgi:hypothetical protein